MVDSTFRNVIEFFDRLGVYDVVLPFLLVFTIVFAILEKTKVFGTEKVGGTEYTKKNLNAMAAFVIALLAVASSKVVSIMNAGLAKIIILMIIGVTFMMLVGTFWEQGEIKLLGAWKQGGMILMAAGVLLIFAYELGWLDPTWDYISNNLNSTVIGAVVLLGLMVWFVYYLGKPAAKPKEEEKKGG